MRSIKDLMAALNQSAARFRQVMGSSSHRPTPPSTVTGVLIIYKANPSCLYTVISGRVARWDSSLQMSCAVELLQCNFWLLPAMVCSLSGQGDFQILPV